MQNCEGGLSRDVQVWPHPVNRIGSKTHLVGRRVIQAPLSIFNSWFSVQNITSISCITPRARDHAQVMVGDELGTGGTSHGPYYRYHLDALFHISLAILHLKMPRASK
jgi:hypothetical protein